MNRSEDPTWTTTRTDRIFSQTKSVLPDEILHSKDSTSNSFVRHSYGYSIDLSPDHSEVRPDRQIYKR